MMSTPADNHEPPRSPQSSPPPTASTIFSEPRKPVSAEQTTEDTAFPPQAAHHDATNQWKSSDETFVNGNPLNQRYSFETEKAHRPESLKRTNSNSKAEEHRLEDDLELLKAERIASRTSKTSNGNIYDIGESHNPNGSPEARSARSGQPWRPVREETNKFAKMVKRIHKSSVWIRYFTYIVPVALILLIPLLLGALKYKEHDVGGVEMMWFMIWLEVVWCTLWLARFVCKLIPYPVGILMSAVTNNYKKWQDMARELELPATLFFWWLAIYCSFLPIMRRNHVDGDGNTKYWEKNANIVLLCIFIATILNLIEKAIIQLIAISFHQRTYADRIELNRFQIGALTKLYQHVKEQEKMHNMYNGDEVPSLGESGTITPRVMLMQAQQGARQALNKVGDVVGKIAGDFTGREVKSSTSPHQVVLTLLSTNDGCNVLARRLYRGFCRHGQENVQAADLNIVFDSEEEADAAFSMFDRDLNGDISVTEMELACGEIGRERKAVIKSLKVLDSVVGKLNECFTFIVAVIVIIVFLTLISKSTAGVLTSASSSILALSWLFSGTAQEFLASLIFVFVKHPFDVGDRVDIYNTGVGTTDTFFVKEISLMYTEFKKLEGHIVQAPNSLLNTLFILNMRRTGGLAEAVPIVVKFGTTMDQLTDLRERMLDFVKSEKREYQGKILTEVRDLPDMHSVKLNVVFFYKSNWQNELVRLSRRNKFICALMCAVHELGIEGPNMRWPGQKPTAPVYLSGLNPSMPHQPGTENHFTPGSGTYAPNVHEPYAGHAPLHRLSSLRSTRETDFSLGMKDMESMDDGGDVFNDTGPRRGVLPSNLRRVVEEDEDETSSIFGRSPSHRSHNSHSSFLRRRRPSNAATNAAVFKPTTGHSIWSRRSHEQDTEPVLPVTEPIQRAGTTGRAGGNFVGPSSQVPSTPRTTVSEDLEMNTMTPPLPPPEKQI